MTECCPISSSKPCDGMLSNLSPAGVRAAVLTRISVTMVVVPGVFLTVALSPGSLLDLWEVFGNQAETP